MSGIPASQIVQVNPSVLNAGGSALAMNGLMLTTNAAVPIGTLLPFSTAADVGTFFGLSSDEYTQAQIYFNGFDNSTKKPGRLFFAQYNTSAVSAYLRGASMAGVTLAQLQALTPSTISLTVDGTLKTSSSINLSAATSFSNAATIIAAAFTGGPNVTYDAQRNAFVFTSTTTGPTSTITVASTSTMATGLGLTAAAGATLSQGAAIATPTTAMPVYANASGQWVQFMTLFEPVTADKLSFSQWTNSQNNRYAYIGWDTDANAAVAGSTTTWLAGVVTNTYSGSIGVYKAENKASFILGAIASIDFTRLNGRSTLAFKSQSGLAADVTDATTATNLKANGYNFYGDYATASQDFVFLYPGQVSGKFQWIDTYINQIWLNNALQQAMVNMLTQVTSVPYNQEGYNLIRSACMDPINAALNFGAIRPGVTLSAAQASAVDNAAGFTISTTLNQRGWYLQISDAQPQVRQSRQSPPMTLWYMDGGSVQQLTLASIVLQ